MRRIYLICLVSVLLVSLGSMSCSWLFEPSTTPSASAWDQTFGGPGGSGGNSVQQTSDGGYIIAGFTNYYEPGGEDVWLIKTDSFGNAAWNKTFSGSDWDRGYSVGQTSDGGYIIAGSTRSYGAGERDAWLIKTDSSGNAAWNKTFGGSEIDDGHSVQQTSDGGYIIAGVTRSYGAGESDALLIKTDSSGNVAWNKTFGGSENDYSYSIRQTSDGGYILAGCTWSHGTGGADVWLIKTDSSGNMTWNKAFGGSEGDSAHSAQQTSDGGYIIAGYTESYGAGDFDFWLIKTDSSGNEMWNKTFGGSDTDLGYSVQQTSDNGYIIAGHTWSYGDGYSDVWVIKTNSSGNKVWNETFGGSRKEFGSSVQQTSDGGYIIAGIWDYYLFGSGDVWLIKIAP